MSSVIQKAIDAINKVLNDHENHLFPDDFEVLQSSVKHLQIMKQDGFE